MPWISDVVPYTTILSTWGNNIRDHVVQVFASKAEMSAQAVPKEGMIAHCADTHITYIRVGTAWWVLGMPWRDWNSPQGYFSSDGGNVWSGMGGSGNLRWRQSMGHFSLSGSFTVSLPISGTSYICSFLLPHTLSKSGPIGTCRVYVAATGLVSGGQAAWANNGGPNNQSRAIVGNFGQAVAANAVVSFPSGSPQVSFDINASYEADPAIDTP